MSDQPTGTSQEAPATSDQPTAATASDQASDQPTGTSQEAPATPAASYSVQEGPLPSGQAVNVPYTLSLEDVTAIKVLAIANIEEAMEELSLSDQRIRTLVREATIKIARVWSTKKHSMLLITEESMEEYKEGRESGDIKSRMSGSLAVATIVWLPKSDIEAWHKVFNDAGLKHKPRNADSKSESDQASAPGESQEAQDKIARAAQAEQERRAQQASAPAATDQASAPATPEEAPAQATPEEASKPQGKPRK